MPDDVMLIVQEIRLDQKPPAMFVFEMKKDTYIPIMQRSFSIPYYVVKAYDKQVGLF